MEECKKVKYPTIKLALEALNKLKGNPKYKVKGVHFCHKCSHWHLTSKANGIRCPKIILDTYRGLK
jgi:hypothetical protein